MKSSEKWNVILALILVVSWWITLPVTPREEPILKAVWVGTLSLASVVVAAEIMATVIAPIVGRLWDLIKLTKLVNWLNRDDR